MTRNPILFGMVHLRSSKSYTKVTLDSFFKNTSLEDNDHLVVIDNDNSFSEINFHHDKLIVISNTVPLPFSKNANILISKSLEAKIDLFLLNNDIIFTKNWLSPFEISIRAIRLPVSNAQFQYRYNNLNLQMSMKLEQFLGFEKELEEIAETHVQNNQGLKLVHTAPYYCVYIPFTVLSSVGFFDEQFVPAGWEDTDYSVRSYL
jgi:GT2 family glycosyltransferase